MNDLVFMDAIYWLLNDYNLKLYLFGSLVFFCSVIGFLHIIRKWGDL